MRRRTLALTWKLACRAALCRMAERAPWISKVRRYTSPRLLIPKSNGLPPLELWRGTRPSQAYNWRPLLKLRASAIEATSALAVSGPMPGIFSSRRLSSLLRCHAWICASSSATCRSSSFS